LYSEKKVDFLLRAFALLKANYPDVALLIVGNGEERKKLEQLSRDLNLRDVHFLGEVLDPRKSAVYFMLADLMVIPAYVGLAIVHGFALGLPLITTDVQGHGPELDYLSEDNGVITKPEISVFSETIRGLLTSSPRLTAMKRCAYARAELLFLKSSVRRFAETIQLIEISRQGQM
jgi:glycosyltransferase involved in cell wall biosynthesis